MSVREFWANIGRAASDLGPNVRTDSSHLNQNRLQGQIQRADLWLNPKAVEGFNRNDFSFLSDAELNDLENLVHNFLEVAREVPPTEPAAQDQSESAKNALAGILNILSPYRYRDIEALITGKQVDQDVADQLPEWVQELRYSTGSDSNAEPGIWVQIVFDPDADHGDEFQTAAGTLIEKIRTSVMRHDDVHWPYVRLLPGAQPAIPHQGRQLSVPHAD